MHVSGYLLVMIVTQPQRWLNHRQGECLVARKRVLCMLFTRAVTLIAYYAMIYKSNDRGENDSNLAFIPLPSLPSLQHSLINPDLNIFKAISRPALKRVCTGPINHGAQDPGIQFEFAPFEIQGCP